MKRSHHCGELRPQHVGQTVTLMGWVNAYRDHGTGLIFVDLRDREGLTQLVFDREDADDALLAKADKVRNEDVIAATGIVRTRDGGPNPKLTTGEIEVVVTELVVLSETETPPFLPSDDKGALPREEIRLRHRYLDLRRPRMQEIMRTRHRVTKVVRDYFDEHGFWEIETPYLCKSTPEGARDFIVPSRNQPGSWYALPQSPQLFKQLLMVAGAERYLQIARCFRDEDPRADRQAEFTQIDCEMSFVDREQVIEVMEGMVRRVWKEVLGVEVPAVDRLTYHEAMNRYGIDRPDRRFGLELVDVSDIARRSEFKVFHGALEKRRGCVKAIRVPGGADKLTRKLTDGYTEFVKQFGAGGVPVVKVNDQGRPETGIARFIEGVWDELAAAVGAEPGDTVLFGADAWSVCLKAMGELRLKVARDLDLIDESKWDFLWVVDFPMFEHDAETNRFYSLHHPFTAPNPDQLEAFLAADTSDIDAIEGIVSAGYDIICNGSEIGGGSIRIHQSAVQSKVFSLLGLSEEEAKDKFSFLLEALHFGAPPHGGIAFGLDRMVMHLAGTDNIRDVIAFPKTQIGADLMTEAPSPVSPEQLRELYVREVEPDAAGG
ncbi:MAG: aspartate--tRNA ligase [Phycisphaerales bacterium]